MWHKLVVFLSFTLMIAVALLILAVSLRGKPGNPNAGEINQESWKGNGPFELSPERGRYALLYSLIEDQSFSFSPRLAAFVTPDLAYKNGKFTSLFPPLLSYIAMPGYLAGREYGLAQVGSFATSSIFALINLCLIYLIARRLGAHPAAAIVGALLFLFATPAYAYAVTLYQHHVTTMLLLLSLLLAVSTRHYLALALVFLLSSAAVTLDSPNAVFFLPVSFYAFARIFQLEEGAATYTLNIKVWRITAIFAAIIPIAFLLYFNQNSYGNMWQLGGTVESTKSTRFVTDATTGELVANETERLNNPPEKKLITNFFQTRNAYNGLYTFTVASDRGILWFTPVMVLSLFGIAAAYKRNSKLATLMLATVGVILSLYVFWLDPYGGWAFGPRYLIPVFAILAPFLAVAITKLIHSLWFLTLLILLSGVSLGINTMGALTSNAVPPRVEYPESEQGYLNTIGWMKGWKMIETGESKSYVYQQYLSRYISPKEMGIIIVETVGAMILLQLFWLNLATVKGKDENRHNKS